MSPARALTVPVAPSCLDNTFTSTVHTPVVIVMVVSGMERAWDELTGGCDSGGDGHCVWRVGVGMKRGRG